MGIEKKFRKGPKVTSGSKRKKWGKRKEQTTDRRHTILLFTVNLPDPPPRKIKGKMFVGENGRKREPPSKCVKERRRGHDRKRNKEITFSLCVRKRVL